MNTKDTPEQARLRAAVKAWREIITKDTDPFNELLAAAEAMLPKREAWADLSECHVRQRAHDMALHLFNAEVMLICDGGILDRAQAIRAACLLKHSKRLMEAWGEVETDKVRDAINAEAERLIGEAGE